MYIPISISVQVVGMGVCDCVHCVEPLNIKRQPVEDVQIRSVGALHESANTFAQLLKVRHLPINLLHHCLSSCRERGAPRRRMY